MRFKYVILNNDDHPIGPSFRITQSKNEGAWTHFRDENAVVEAGIQWYVGGRRGPFPGIFERNRGAPCRRVKG